MATTSLQCEYTVDCPDRVQMIDTKGYIYCEHHGRFLRMYLRSCRHLTKPELAKIADGQTVPYRTVRATD